MLPVIVCVTAYADGETALSAGVGWATFSTPGKKTAQQMSPPAITPDFGGTLSVTYERAVSTDFSLRGDVAGAMFTGGGPGGRSFAALGTAGATFRFDVLKYVPYAFAGVGGLVSSGGAIDKGGELVVTIGGGLDYLLGRDHSAGVEARLASFGGDVTVFTVGVRGTIRWGYF